MGDFKILPSSTNKTSRQIRKDTEDLNNTIHKFVLLYLHTTQNNHITQILLNLEHTQKLISGKGHKANLISKELVHINHNAIKAEIGWMASPTRWTRLWVNSGSWWWTGRPGVLRFMGSQRVGHDWATELNWKTHRKRPWCWERLRAGGEGDDRGWDGWMASSTQWTWVWVDSRSWWWTRRLGVLWFMGSQELDTTELLNRTELNMIPEVINLMAPESTHDVGFKWEGALSPTVLSL